MKASVFVGTSVDGFIARNNGEFDFLPAEDGGPHGFEEFFESVDALVIGRKTYETVLAFDQWFYGDKPVFVLSTNDIPPAPPEATVEHMSGAPASIYAELESRGFQHLYVDGGVTIQNFLRAELIGRLIVTRVPVLIGEGIPLFGPIHDDISLKHVRTETYEGGLVQSEYEVIRPNRSRNTGNPDLGERI